MYKQWTNVCYHNYTIVVFRTDNMVALYKIRIKNDNFVYIDSTEYAIKIMG